jgi:hypothetical protein
MLARMYLVLQVEEYCCCTQDITAIGCANNGRDSTCYDVRPILMVLLQNDPSEFCHPSRTARRIAPICHVLVYHAGVQKQNEIDRLQAFFLLDGVGMETLVYTPCLKWLYFRQVFWIWRSSISTRDVQSWVDLQVDRLKKEATYVLSA